MGKLLETYEQLTKVAEQDTEKQAQVELLQKYAEIAEEALKNQGQEYTKDDIVKVASWMIEQDVTAAEEEEKIAEYDDAGRVMARAFVDEFSKTATSLAAARAVISKLSVGAKTKLYDEIHRLHDITLGTKEIVKTKASDVAGKIRGTIKKYPYHVAGGALGAGGAGGYIIGRNRE